MLTYIMSCYGAGGLSKYDNRRLAKPCLKASLIVCFCFSNLPSNIWTMSQENLALLHVNKKTASAQSGLHLCCSPSGMYSSHTGSMQNFNILASLCS